MSDTIDQTPGVRQELSTTKKVQKKREPAKEGKPSKAELFWRLKAVVDRKPTALRAQFPEIFHVYKSDTTTKLVFSEDTQGVCQLVNERYLSYTVAKYLAEVLIKDATDAWVFTAKDLADFAKLWVSFAEPVDEPRSWAFKSSPGRTFVRLPWDPEPGPTPTWDALLSRASAPEALMAYLGSLFVDASDRQQYLWLYGEGNDGKGSLFRFLHRCFGSAFGNEYVPERGDSRFWTSGLLNKRVVVFPDCNHYGFVTTGLFKSLSGGDPVRIERKGEQAFTALIHAKFIFGSNERPKISDEKSDLRRLIYCELRSWHGGSDPTFERRLWEEGGAFIHNCLEAYGKASPTHAAIEVDQDRLSALASDTEEVFEAAAAHFNFSPAHSCPASAFYAVVQGTVSRNDYVIRKFKRYLERTYGIRKEHRREDGRRVWHYVGVCPKSYL